MNNPLFVMDTAFCHASARFTPMARAQMLAELGYAGTSASLTNQQAWDELPALIEALDRHRLTLFAIGVPHDVHTGEVDPRLEAAMRLLAGRPTLIELALRSSGEHDRPSSSRADSRGAAMIRKVAAVAKPHRVRISLYPQQGFWMERTQDAVRLLMRLNDPALGLTFNHAHWLRVDGAGLEDRLLLAAPRMLNATIDGSANIDRSNYLGLLQRLGYTGPVGLQCIGNDGGDPYDQLRQSITDWSLRTRG